MYLLFINNRNVNNVNIMIHKQNEFMDNVGLTEDNRLVHLLNTYDCENDEEINILTHSKYCSTNDFKSWFQYTKFEYTKYFK